MNSIYGKVFMSSDGEEFGVIRKGQPPFPAELSNMKVIAKDECGNYFIEELHSVLFWDHELSTTLHLAKTYDEFLLGCKNPSEVVLKSGQVKSAWIDPDFAKEFGIESKS
ncbi:SMI1/KNR4 family protein [Photobacterium frigidiphilum]|uniref:SMI1/KNR4 family protein n=1 Tax=Photobacterium frigidiphilum TaxID=264736 RepID=UPI003D0E8C11